MSRRTRGNGPTVLNEAIPFWRYCGVHSQVGEIHLVNEAVDKIRRICARLIDAPPNSAVAADYRLELKAAAAQLESQEKEWNQAAEGNKHQ
jgi:hypothetical protein